MLSRPLKFTWRATGSCFSDFLGRQGIRILKEYRGFSRNLRFLVGFFGFTTEWLKGNGVPGVRVSGVGFEF